MPMIPVSIRFPEETFEAVSTVAALVGAKNARALVREMSAVLCTGDREQIDEYVSRIIQFRFQSQFDLSISDGVPVIETFPSRPAPPPDAREV